MVPKIGFRLLISFVCLVSAFLWAAFIRATFHWAGVVVFSPEIRNSILVQIDIFKKLVIHSLAPDLLKS